MKSPAPRVLLVLMLGTSSSLAQLSPGVSAKPSGRTLDEPEATPAMRPVDLSRPQPQPPMLELTLEEEAFFAPAMRGEVWAQTKLGKLYITASGDETRARQGLDLLQSAAEQNDAEAIYLMATLAATGIGVERSDVDAFEQMKRAAVLGFADAQFALGSMYFAGRGTARNEAAAVEVFRRAAEGGNREAMFSAGRILLSKTEPETRAEGLALMNRAVENGHIEATLMLATAYGRGENGLPKDEAKAEALLKPGAERGDADCQMTLASLYKFGDTFAARRDEAEVWLQRAADQGHPRAMEILRSGAEEMQRPAEPAGPPE